MLFRDQVRSWRVFKLNKLIIKLIIFLCRVSYIKFFCNILFQFSINFFSYLHFFSKKLKKKYLRKKLKILNYSTVRSTALQCAIDSFSSYAKFALFNTRIISDISFPKPECGRPRNIIIFSN
ncbi:hypothetical protein BpHYR1_018110 [Brachionus plicatilis]|uniref:Uncharacterized protein n=1 Tax=Brachionus plicatilis TaxID=10195 RepID=A0A3M7T2D5_BRAPC|nr:hypothetical protein BpHYR1_018110 [Brachionus plicatilis]